MKLHYCPSCARVYYLAEDQVYLCGRVHAPAVLADGRLRKVVISEKTETNQPPWPLPLKVEVRELLNQDLTETWLSECKFPEDEDYSNVERHFGFRAPGGKHLTRDEVLTILGGYILKLTD